MATKTALVLIAAAGVHAEQSRANPIRKVVTMLQNVQGKVEAEGKHEEELFKKYMCYCKSGGAALEQGIADNNAKVPEIQSSIEAGIAQDAQLKEDLKKHQADRATAKTTMAESTAIREKEAAAFAAMKDETSSNIAAMTKAIAALEKGAGGAFVQTSAASVLHKWVTSKVEMDEEDRQDVVAFLESANSENYSPQSGQITGILKASEDEMSAALAEATKSEKEAIASYGDLMAAKKKEVDACTAAIEAKTVRVGELAVEIVQMKNELSESEEGLIEDKKFLADLQKNCKTKEAEWDEVVKMRAEELVALSETIKILNSDDALELFKKALPSAASSFVQVDVNLESTRSRALAEIRRGEKSGNPNLQFIALALRGKKVGFEKVIKMIDDMVVLLKQEQTDDNDKKEYCDIQFESMDDAKKELERNIEDTKTAVADAEESIKAMTSEVESLTKGLKQLDKSVAEATEQRKEENEDFTTLMAQDSAAKELLNFAKNRLNKFYNPKMYKEPPKEEAVLVAVSAHAQHSDAPPPPPEAPGAYKKKGEESTGVIAMIDAIVADLDKEMTVAEAEEKNAQKDYETMMSDSAEKRAKDTSAIKERESAKADTTASLEGHKDSLKEDGATLMATLQTIQGLHGECDWLIQYFDVRKEARENEIGALGKAKAVLSGADYSLLQTTKRLRGQN